MNVRLLSQGMNANRRTRVPLRVCKKRTQACTIASYVRTDCAKKNVTKQRRARIRTDKELHFDLFKEEINRFEISPLAPRKDASS
jgi:hypothetical protein